MTRRVLVVALGLFLALAGEASAASITLTVSSEFGSGPVQGLPQPTQDPGNASLFTLPQTIGSIYLGNQINICVDCSGDNFFFSTNTGLQFLKLADISFTAGYDTDPSIAYGATATTLGVPVILVYSFATPYIGGPYTQLDQQLHASLSAGGAPLIQQVAQATGVLPLSPLVCSLSPNNCNATRSDLGAFAATGTLQSTVTLQLNAASALAFNGRVDLLNVPSSSAVPEPTSMVLLGSGVVAAVMRRRKSRT